MHIFEGFLLLKNTLYNYCGNCLTAFVIFFNIEIEKQKVTSFVNYKYLFIVIFITIKLWISQKTPTPHNQPTEGRKRENI